MKSSILVNQVAWDQGSGCQSGSARGQLDTQGQFGGLRPKWGQIGVGSGCHRGRVCTTAVWPFGGNPRCWLIRSRGIKYQDAKWAQPAANDVPGVSAEDFRSGWDQGAESEQKCSRVVKALASWVDQVAWDRGSGRQVAPAGGCFIPRVSWGGLRSGRDQVGVGSGYTKSGQGL